MYVGEDQHKLGLIVAPGQRDEAAGKDYWPGTDAYCRYLVGSHVGLVYLGWHHFQLRTSIIQIRVPGWAALWKAMVT